MSTVFIEMKPTSFHVPDILYENRYCNQEDFSILVCGGRDKKGKYLNRVWELKLPQFEACGFPFMIKLRYKFSLVNLNNDILALGGDKSYSEVLKKSMKSIEIYSNKTNFWQEQYIQVEEKFNYCVCSFI